jgi:hypothetical protein
MFQFYYYFDKFNKYIHISNLFKKYFKKNIYQKLKKSKINNLPVVPLKAVAEVSKIGNL